MLLFNVAGLRMAGLFLAILVHFNSCFTSRQKGKKIYLTIITVFAPMGSVLNRNGSKEKLYVITESEVKQCLLLFFAYSNDFNKINGYVILAVTSLVS